MKRPINVMQLISSLEVGGAEKLLLSLLEASRVDPRINFIIVVMNRDVNPTLKARLNELGYPVYYLGRKKGHKHPKYLIQLLHIIRHHKVNIIHMHNYGSKMWGILCKFCQPRLKLVTTIHDTGLMNGQSIVYKWAHGHIINLNIAISKVVENECLRNQLTNVKQIYNGIPLHEFHPANIQNLPFNRRFRIINVARMDHHKKGQDILLRALRHCKVKGIEFECLLVGGVYSYNLESFEYLHNLTKSLQLENDVSFLTDRSDVADLLQQSDLFVLPSRFEGLGLVVLEAMACGVPVVASRIDGPAELISNGINGVLFEVDRADQLAEKIIELAQSRDERKRLCQNALLFVRQFDIQLMKEQYIQAYRGLWKTIHTPIGLNSLKMLEAKS